MKHRTSVGALWMKAGHNGGYLDGRIDGVDVVIFRNELKTTARQPDWHILKSRGGRDLAPTEKRLRIGALWCKQGRKGDYLAGNANGLGVLVFPNERKRKRREPDWHVVKGIGFRDHALKAELDAFARQNGHGAPRLRRRS